MLVFLQVHLVRSHLVQPEVSGLAQKVTDQHHRHLQQEARPPDNNPDNKRDNKRDNKLDNKRDNKLDNRRGNKRDNKLDNKRDNRRDNRRAWEVANPASLQAVNPQHHPADKQVVAGAEVEVEVEAEAAASANHAVNLLRVLAINVNRAERRSQRRIQNLWAFNPKRRELHSS